MTIKTLNKRIGLVSCLIIISLCTFTFSKTRKGDIISTMSVPVTNKVIVIDAGHGGEDRRSSK